MPDLEHCLAPVGMMPAKVALAVAAPDKDLMAPELEGCSICLNFLEQPTITPCGHWFCK